MYRFLLLLITSITTAILPGQRGLEEIILSYPLEQEKIDFVSQSSEGLFWFAGVGGLIRYDGAIAEKMWISDENAPEISHDQNVQSPMFEDKDGQLWFSTASAFHSFNPRTNRFSTFQIELNGYPILEDYRPFHLDLPRGELWLKAGNQLWRWRLDDGAYKKIAGPTSAVNFTVRSTDLPGEMEIFGSRWIRPGIEYYQINEERDFAPLQETGQNIRSITTLALGRDSLLVGAMEGLFLLTNPGGIWQNSPVIPERLKASISGLVKTTDGEVFVSCNNEAVYHFTSSSLDPELLNISRSDVELKLDKLFIDNYGALWVSRRGNGFNIIRPTNWFRNLNPPSGEEIIELVQVSQKELIIICSSTNYYRGRLKTTEKSTFQGPDFIEWTLLPAPIELKTASQKLMYSNHQLYSVGNRWIGILDLETDIWTISTKPSSSLGELLFLGGGKTILATETGLYETSRTTLDDWIPVSYLQPAGGNYFTGFFIINDSLSLLEYQGNQLWHLAHQNDELKLIEKTTIPINPRCVLLTEDEILYIGTNSGLYILQDKVAKSVAEPTGHLATLDILSLTQSDLTDLIWLTTRKGMYAYDPTLNSLAFFSKESGLPYDRFLRIAPITFAGGFIGMSTKNGIVVFDPSGPAHQNEAMPYLASIKVNDKPLQQAVSPGFLTSLNQPHKKNSFDFKLSTVTDGFSSASAVEYQLINHDRKPTRVVPGTTISYPNLPPGNYTLQLTAINRNGLPSGKKSLGITIHPPFTQTLLFYILCTCALALIAIGLYILGLRRERLKQQRLQEQQARLAAERDRIAGEVHDDLGGQISSILYLSEEMLLAGDTPEYEYELSRINELSRSSLQNVRDIIFALDNRRATLSALGEQLSGAGEAFFGDRKISFRNSEHYAQPEFVLTSRQKRNLTLIVKEAWHNVAKHAKATVVTFDIQEVDQKLVITVADNGVGFTSTTSENDLAGYGLDNMQEKATAIGGQLTIESTPGQGTSLQITWPLPTND